MSNKLLSLVNKRTKPVDCKRFISLLTTFRALWYHQIGFLDSVFFVCLLFLLIVFSKSIFYRQAACLCNDLLVLNSLPSRSQVLFCVRIFTPRDDKLLHFLLRALRYHQIGFIACDLFVLPPLFIDSIV